MSAPKLTRAGARMVRHEIHMTACGIALAADPDGQNEKLFEAVRKRAYRYITALFKYLNAANARPAPPKPRAKRKGR